MIMRKIQVVMIGTLLCGIALPCYVQGQNNSNSAEDDRRQSKDLNREMTLEREYDPIVQDAAKINTLPVVREVNISKRPIVYSDFATPISPDKKMNVLPAGKLMTDVEHNTRNGYLHFGGGMLMNLNGDFGYHLLNTDRDNLGVWFSHRSTNGNVKFSDSEITGIDKRKAKFNDNIGGLDYKHHFDAATLTLGGKFGHSTFNYYGLPTNIIMHPLSYSDVSLRSFPQHDTVSNQANRLINGYAGVSSKQESSIGYHLGVDYTNFKQKYSLSSVFDGMTENHICLDLGINSPNSDGRYFGVDAKVNILSYTEPSPVSDVLVDSTAFNTHFNATLSPYYHIEGDAWKLLLGLNAMLVAQNGETNVFVSPNIALDVPLANWSLFYAKLGGGVESNAMADISRTNRYINPAFTVDASKTWADIKLGISSSASAGLWFDIFAGYKYTESDVLFNPSSYFWINNGFNNVSMAFQPNTQRLQLGATLKYDYKQVVDFYIKGVYNHYNLKYRSTWKNTFGAVGLGEDDEMKAYGKPSLVVNAGVNVRPVNPLTLSLDYCMMSGIYAYVNENVKMDAINDLRLRASWKFNDTFSVYAQFNNLLFQKQELYYGYPLQPFSAMAGFNVNF